MIQKIEGFESELEFQPFRNIGDFLRCEIEADKFRSKQNAAAAVSENRCVGGCGECGRAGIEFVIPQVRRGKAVAAVAGSRSGVERSRPCKRAQKCKTLRKAFF